MADPRSLVQGVELWVPRRDALLLRSGAYGPHAEFARVSARSQFQVGEGLPRAVWAAQRALVWHDLGSHFVRGAHAAAAGIDAAVGLPWFAGSELTGVLILLLTKTTSARGCIEVWNLDEGVQVMKHGGGLYANTPELERLSCLLQFPYAAGLPGLSWSTGMPVVLEDVRASNEFIRAELAEREGLRRAFGLPIFRAHRIPHVLTLIGGADTSFVRTFELFVPSEPGLSSKLRREDLADSRARELHAGSDVMQKLCEQARSQGLPVVASGSESALTSGHAGILLALPMHDGRRLRAVACLEF